MVNLTVTMPDGSTRYLADWPSDGSPIADYLFGGDVIASLDLTVHCGAIAFTLLPRTLGDYPIDPTTEARLGLTIDGTTYDSMTTGASGTLHIPFTIGSDVSDVPPVFAAEIDATLVAPDGTSVHVTGHVGDLGAAYDPALRWTLTGAATETFVDDSGTFVALQTDGFGGSWLWKGDPTTGSKVTLAEGVAYGAILRDDDGLYAITDASTLASFSPTGTLEWSASPFPTFRSDPTLATDGRVCIVGDEGAGEGLACVDATGAPTFSISIVQANQPIGLPDGEIAIVAGDPQAVLFVQPDGTTRRFDPPCSDAFADGSLIPRPAGGVYATVGDYLFAVDASANLVWQVPVGFYPHVVEGADGTLFVLAGNADQVNLFAIQPDGTVAWTQAVGNASSLAVATGGSVLVSTAERSLVFAPDGTVTASAPETGEVLLGRDGSLFVGGTPDSSVVQAIDVGLDLDVGGWPVRGGNARRSSYNP
jgi:hypothetical protein